MRHIFTVLLVFGLLVSTSSSLAEDLNPPNWRGNARTSWAQWEFLTPDPLPLPDAGFLPWGDPITEVYPLDPWVPGVEPHVGVWPLSGEVIVTLQNWPEPNPLKEIWIQITWAPQFPGAVPEIQILDPLGSPINTPLAEQPLDGDWVHSTYHLQIYPNPPFETIRIAGDINLDELVIDTWCVPEPAALCLLGLGGLTMLRRRR